jgi:hypothetical protein
MLWLQNCVVCSQCQKCMHASARRMHVLAFVFLNTRGPSSETCGRRLRSGGVFDLFSSARVYEVCTLWGA